MTIREELTLKNLKPLIFILVVLILTVISVYPQRKFSGRVAEVVDGKTFVIELPNGRVTGVLQYIEIPEPEQPLRDTIKEHLTKMILDKTVEFEPRIVLRDRTIGRLFLDGVDVSRQMLRDGAAWYATAEKNSQTEDERILYEDNETRAKLEKRGIWGVENLKPAWEFRADKEAEKEEQRRQQFERMKAEAAKNSMQTRPQPTTYGQQSFGGFQNWMDIRTIDSEAGVGGIVSKFDSQYRYGYMFTTQAQIAVSGNPKKSPYLDFRLMYAFLNPIRSDKDKVYAVAILSESDEYQFEKSNRLTVLADKQKIELGRAYRLSGDVYSAKREVLLYLISRSSIQKIAGAKSVQVNVGTYSGRVSEKIQMMAKNLLNSAE